MATLVYKYSLRAPVEGAEIVRDQMRLHRAYRNTLVQIERGRREARRALDLRHGNVDALARAADAALEAERAAAVAVKAAKSDARSRTVPQELRDALAAARPARKAALDALKEARRRNRDDGDYLREIDEIETRAADLRRNARAYSGLASMGPHVGAWGTYQFAEDADMSARKAPLYDGAEPNDPRFVRRSGQRVDDLVERSPGAAEWFGDDGAVSVQLTNDEDAEAALGCAGSWLRIERVVPQTRETVHAERLARARRELAEGGAAGARAAKWIARNEAFRGGASTRREQFTTLRLRVGSNGRDPIWAAWPMLMHRDLPPGAIKRVTVHRSHVGPREVWSVEFTINALEASRPARGGAVAVDLGWRQIPEGRLRVAWWRGDDGESGEIALDAHIVSGASAHPAALRSTRDKAFNAAIARLTPWLAGRSDLPGWLRAEVSHIAQWKSPARLSVLALRWGARRFDGDAEEYAAIEAWRYHEHHLAQWESSARAKAEYRRDAVFRNAAAMLSERYDTLVLEGDERGKLMDLRDMKRRPKSPDERDDGSTHTRRNSDVGAPGRLRLVLLNAFRGTVGDGVGRASIVLGANTTRRCHACGHTEAWDSAATTHHRCSACSELWEQDDNATRNLLMLHGERLRDARSAGVARGDDSDAETAAPAESRWVKAKRMRAEKDARQEAARKALADVAE